MKDEYFRGQGIWIDHKTKSILGVASAYEAKPGHQIVVVTERGGRFRDRQMSARKLRRHLAHHKYQICDIEDGDIVEVRGKPGLHKITVRPFRWGPPEFRIGLSGWVNYFDMKLVFKG